MIRDGYQPVSEAGVHIIIEVRQRAVSDEAGDIGSIPEDMYHIVTHNHDATSLWS